MRWLLILRVADFRVVGECDDSRGEFRDFGFQSVNLRLLPEDDLAELLEIVLDVHQQEFDVDDSIVGGGSGHEISNFRFQISNFRFQISDFKSQPKWDNGSWHSAIGFRPGMVGRARGNSSGGCDTLAAPFHKEFADALL